MNPAALSVTLLLALVWTVASGSDGPDPGCPGTTWVRHGDYCYWFDQTVDMMHWPQAVQRCYSEHPGALVANIHTEEENNFITNFTHGYNTWLGLVRFPGNEWSWTDGSPVSYTHWGAGEPAEGRNCSYHFNDHWYSADCLTYTLYLLCQIPVNDCTPGTGHTGTK